MEVGGAGPDCLVADFSAVALPRDNAVAFQVRLDGVPMRGHLGGLNGVPAPAVADPREGALALDRMVAYHFFAPVRPGVHRVEVLFASCSAKTPPRPRRTLPRAPRDREQPGAGAAPRLVLQRQIC